MLKWIIRFAAALFFGSILAPASAQTPVWDLYEVYSNADGSIQFVVHMTSESGQQFLGGLTLVANGGGVTHTFTFPHDLPGDSAGHFFLIATQGFADLDVLPPDYVVPNGFFPVSGAVIWVAGHGYEYGTLSTDGTQAYRLCCESWGLYGTPVARNFAGGKYTFASAPTLPVPPPPAPPPALPPPTSPPNPIGPSATLGMAIGPGFTGAWFDPAQTGHGLFVEVLSDNRFLAWWYAFNPAGTEQSWFGGVGTYSGDTAIITDVYQTVGGHWIPNFDPTRIVNKPWGTLTFTFADCNHGRVNFDSVAGFGTGSMSLTRLTQPAGLSCP